MTNINPNDDVLRINQNIRKGSKKNMEKEVVVQPKQVEASSLNALSSYGKAKVTFRGQVSETEDKNSLENFEKRLLAEKDENGKCIFGESRIIKFIMEDVDENNLSFAEKLCLGKDENGNDFIPDKTLIPEILFAVKQANIDFSDSTNNKSQDFIDAEFVEKICFGKDENGNYFFPDKLYIDYVISNAKELPKSFVEKLLWGIDEEGEPLFNDKKLIPNILAKTNQRTLSIVERLCFERKANGQKVFPDEKAVGEILNWTYAYNAPIVEKLCFSKDTLGNPIARDSEEIKKILISIKGEEECVKKALALLDLCEKNQFSACLIPNALEGHISVKDYNSVLNLLGREKVSSLSAEDLILSVRNNDLYKKEDINDFTFEEKKKLLQEIILQNTKLFAISEALKKDFPLIPKNANEYCNFVRELSDSVQINTEKLTKKELKRFDSDLNLLAESISQKSEEDFEKLIIKNDGVDKNKIQSNDKNIEKTINDMLEVCPNALPEDCEKIKNALKVIKNMSSNYIYNQLKPSDKKVMLFTALLKDCDENPKKSAFNAFYILQKFDLCREDRDKAYLLIRNQDWLKRVNGEEKYSEEIKSIAFDLHYSNLFEMQKLLAESDLSSKYNLFKNEKEIGYLVEELKNSQPLLPVTAFPSSDRIKDAISVVNDDYSTNLKGIYQDEKGMVIIKFNEVENETWEKIGFSQGTISKGIETVGFQKKGKETTEVKCSTGNIKFFVHALDKEEALGNFVVFGMPDSEALLSVSYAERPESKYRFFRPQGVILNAPARCVYGGGYSSSGSGSAKSIEKFKKLYAYMSGHRHQDRTFVSELIKKEMGFNDDEYVNFVEKNMNKPLSEIEPEEMQVKLIKILAGISSRVTSIGDRNYNEMYVSNPEIMGVFAYPWEEAEIGEVKTFVNNQKDFLKDYAVENNVPFVIFGD